VVHFWSSKVFAIRRVRVCVLLNGLNEKGKGEYFQKCMFIFIQLTDGFYFQLFTFNKHFDQETDFFLELQMKCLITGVDISLHSTLWTLFFIQNLDLPSRRMCRQVNLYFAYDRRLCLVYSCKKKNKHWFQDTFST